MRSLFYLTFATIFVMTFFLGYFWSNLYWSLLLTAPLFVLGCFQSLQKKKAILRNYPLLGGFRYIFEMIRPEIQQYFVESETDGTPIPREIRSVVYQRAKQQTDTLPFGTQINVYEDGYEWISHSLSPKTIDQNKMRVHVGGPDCRKPYSSNRFNISAMSYGALSKNAILALNGGAKMGGFYHNTGEGGVSPYHLSEGGDLVWQIGTGYFGCRDVDGKFSPSLFQAMAGHENIKMIEVKLSQGAKPGHGGILPAAKITQEIIEIRKVEAGKDVISPAAHSAFSTPKELLQFVHQLRNLSGGKPVGFKLCIGQPTEFIAICKAMLELKITPDFITVDGGEGGTGAAPMEFSDHVGMPLEEGLSFVHNILVGYDLRKNIKIISSGKIFTGFQLYTRMALGADICNTARGMMLALGCIQARRCNTNHCPTGVATSNKELVYGLDPGDKKVRIFNYQKNTIHAFTELLGATGFSSPEQIQRRHVHRRVAGAIVKTYEDLFPSVKAGDFLIEKYPDSLIGYIQRAQADDFSELDEVNFKQLKATA